MSAVEERIEVVKEEQTYHRGVERSMFKDMIDAEQGDFGASERLRRHHREISDVMEKRDREARSQQPDGVEYRTNPNTTTGQGGYFAPPLWIIDQFATAPRAKRVLASQVPRFDLPQGVHSVNLPRLTTGNTEAAVGDLAPDPSTDAVDASVTCNVVTISGHGDVSLQLLDQSPPGAHLDWAFFQDLTEAYDANLEFQMLNGSTTLGQLPGIIGIAPTTNKITYTDGSPLAYNMFPYLGEAIAAIGDNRKLPPELWLMTTSRLGWIGTQEDKQSRPLLLADVDGSGKFDIITIETMLDDAIPTTLGAGGNQDTIIACRPSDMLLFESSPRARVHLEVLSGTLQARIQLHHYAAFLVRYPSAVSYLTGTGMIVQSGF